MASTSVLFPLFPPLRRAAWLILPLAALAGLLAACASGSGPSAAMACFEGRGGKFNEVLACYRQAGAARPLTYSYLKTTQLQQAQKRSFELVSQSWPADGSVSPQQWKHNVDIYIPDHPLTGRAIMVANNGINIAGPGPGDTVRGASDFTEAMALNIAEQTRTIVVSVSNLPNQYLTYADGLARREDDSVAHSWQLFVRNPRERPFMSVHLPMAEALSKAMDLAQRELEPWRVGSFIATGASKRGWAVWLAAIADPRIDAIAPFAADVLNLRKVLEHTSRAYGGNWPLAFGPYLQENVATWRPTLPFGFLGEIEDPLSYLASPYAGRLAIPKYLVSASGDDFFMPDNASFSFESLPGEKGLRVAPNTSHGGIRQSVEQSLVPFVNRVQKGQALPAMSLSRDAALVLQSLDVSEMPVEVKRWTATNPAARDFRYACGIRYGAIDVAPARHVALDMVAPSKGWSASFLEMRFADGLVLTSPVQVLPQTYPDRPPPEDGKACRTLSDPAPPPVPLH